VADATTDDPAAPRPGVVEDGDLRIERYRPAERVNHWIVAITFVLAGLSGLALFHPALYWVSNLFGGGPWTRILHPFISVTLVVAFALLAEQFWRDNLMQAADWQWLRQWRDVLGNHEDKLPPVGRYNAGQKGLFWVMVASVLILAASGVVIWRPWFAYAFPITLVRLATLAHALTACGLVLGIIVHVYAAIWTKGSIGAMVRGTVSRRWAARHHAIWLKEKLKGD
jgi:formate dehydrogenase subunit gamma